MQPSSSQIYKSTRALVLAFSLLLSTFCGAAQAHGEFVRTDITLEPKSGTFELMMIGQSSQLPILQAKIQAQLYPLTPALKASLGPNQDLDWNRLEPENRLTYAVLEDQGGGQYLGQLEGVKPGSYALLLVDTTFQGESANSARAIQVGGTQVKATLILPKTNTPTSYLVYALLGLLIPLGILGGILGVAWLDRRGKLKA
jgi:hypothetical protein